MLRLVVLLALAAPAEALPHKPCGVRLDAVKPASGAPGQELELQGRWGDAQGTKLPVLNKGDVNKLEILSWSDTLIRARIPASLRPGTYKLGVYCGLAQGSPYSTDWRDFNILAGGAAAPQAPVERSEQTQPRPGPWREEFIAQWQRKGSELREAPWLADRRILILRSPGVNPGLAGQVSASLTAVLLELGARRLHAKVDELDLPLSLSVCSRNAVLDSACVREAIAGLRRDTGPLAGSILVLVTDAAIDRLPELQPDGSMIGPPAGEADYGEGWFIISGFWDGWNRTHGRGSSDPAFLAHSLDHTVRHEFLHVLGLPHHERLENPGFPEPPLCTECTHENAGGHAAAPHSECGMFCGASDDDWFHRRTFGKGFGFCDKCLTAAKAVVAGIERP
ncbi:MAG: hypothetical protein HY926_08145 [Elusimicrobia bacterium]|nr:hypothetical protein [Elusimicrobiota bacterium]